MKILHVTDYLHPERLGGSSRLVMAHLRILAARGHRVALLAGHPGDAPAEILPDVPFHAFPYPAGLFQVYRGIRGRVEDVIRSEPPDRIVFHQPLSANMTMRRTGRIPYIYAFHSPWSREHLLSATGPTRRMGASLRRVLEGRALRGARRITVESRYMMEEACRMHDLPPSRFARIPGGVDLERFRPAPDREALRKRLQLPEGILAFTLRRLVPRMGVENLIRAVSDLPGVILIIGGAGPEEDRLRDLGQAVGEGRVRMLGLVPEADLADLHAAADVFVVPSRDLEGFGLATVEALASGTPVLATPIGANREVLADLDPDLILDGIDPASMRAGLRKVQEGRWRDDDFRRRCRRYAEERYSWESAVDRFEALLQEG